MPHFALSLVGAWLYPLQIRWQYSCNYNVPFLLSSLIFSEAATSEVEVFHAWSLCKGVFFFSIQTFWFEKSPLNVLWLKLKWLLCSKTLNSYQFFSSFSLEEKKLKNSSGPQQKLMNAESVWIQLRAKPRAFGWSAKNQHFFPLSLSTL